MAVRRIATAAVTALVLAGLTIAQAGSAAPIRKSTVSGWRLPGTISDGAVVSSAVRVSGPQKRLIVLQYREPGGGPWKVAGKVRTTPSRQAKAQVTVNLTDGRWVWKVNLRGAAWKNIGMSLKDVREFRWEVPSQGKFGKTSTAPARIRALEEVTAPVRDTTPPPAPQGLSVDYWGTALMMLTWSAVPADDLSPFSPYTVFKSTARGGPWERVGQTTDTGMLIDTPPRGEPHWYAVQAADMDGNLSEMSQATSFTRRSIEQVEARVVELTNQARTNGVSCGGMWMGPVPPLTVQPQLASAARAHAVDMGTRAYFNHTNPEGLGPLERARAVGYMGSVGENLVGGSHLVEDDVVSTFASSIHHCRNMMSPEYTEIGVGFYDNPNYSNSNMRFLYVQKLGRP